MQYNIGQMINEFEEGVDNTVSKFNLMFKSKLDGFKKDSLVTIGIPTDNAFRREIWVDSERIIHDFSNDIAQRELIDTNSNDKLYVKYMVSKENEIYTFTNLTEVADFVGVYQILDSDFVSNKELKIGNISIKRAVV